MPASAPTTTSNSRKTSLRKAAIVVACLAPNEIDSLLDQMPEEQASLVRRMMFDLGEISASEQEAALDEFLRAKRGSGGASGTFPGGVELDARLARRIAEAGGDERRYGGTTNERPFEFLRDATGEKITPVLANEHPQTVALVISHLPPERAASVIAKLSPANQAEVLRRLSDLDEAHPDVLREVERGLISRMEERSKDEQRKSVGLAHVALILASATPDSRRQLMSNLTRHDRDLASRLGGPRFEFTDLEKVDDEALATIFAAAEPEAATLALVGASPNLIGRILGFLPEAEAKGIRRQLDNMGPTPLSDLEEARRRIAERATELAAEGTIEWPRDHSRGKPARE